MRYSPDTETSHTRKVLIVDDHPVVREGLATLLRHEGYERVECATDPQSAIDSLRIEPAALVLLDLGLGKHSGLDLIRKLVEEWPSISILVCSMHDERLYAERCLRAGAKGYVMKGEPTGVLLEAVRCVMEGNTYAGSIRKRRLAGELSRWDREGDSPEAALTDRELEVYRMLGQGLTASEIAEGLAVSIDTLRSCHARMKSKLGMPVEAEVASRALERHTESRVKSSFA